MARAKNTNKLSSAFYKAHDFLRFGDVLTDIKLARKGDYQNSLKQMEILQGPTVKLANSILKQELDL